MSNRIRESGIIGINTVSHETVVEPLKYCLCAGKNNIKAGPFGSQLAGADFVDYDTGFWVYNQRTVIDDDYLNGNAFVSKEKYHSMSSFTVNEGDVLITTRGTIGKVSRVPEGFMPGILHPCIIKFRLNEDVITYRLIKRIFNETDIVSSQLLFLSNATTIDVIYIDSLKKIKIPIPPRDKQEKIADILDQECSKIDSLISYVQNEVMTLEEYKRSTIIDAVTKGLSSTVELKSSGIPWIGDVPKHWNLKKGKYFLRYLQKPVRTDDGVITCFRDGEVTLRTNRREEGFTMSEKEIGYQGIDIGDLVIHGMDGFAGAIGISDSRGKGSPVLNVLETDHNKKYIMYYLRSMAYADVFLAMSTGIRVRSCDLRWEKLANIFYPLPPKEEQDEIANYIDEVVYKTDSLITAKKRQIDTLKEYKSSLIYEYVTGKKEIHV